MVQAATCCPDDRIVLPMSLSVLCASTRPSSMRQRSSLTPPSRLAHCTPRGPPLLLFPLARPASHVSPCGAPHAAPRARAPAVSAARDPAPRVADCLTPRTPPLTTDAAPRDVPGTRAPAMTRPRALFHSPRHRQPPGAPHRLLRWCVNHDQTSPLTGTYESTFLWLRSRYGPSTSNRAWRTLLGALYVLAE